MTNHDAIVVLGGGPAGAAVAIGLVRLGYTVTLVTEPRRFSSIEGVSERTVAGLRNAGFHSALDAVGDPSPRRVVWNGEINQANTERLVDRCALDQGIRSDLARSGVQVIEGRVITVASADRRHHVTIGQDGKRQVLSAGFLVEARGRAAPLAQTDRLRGVETVSLLQIWRGPPVPPGSMIQSFEDGWIWVAIDPAGARYVQLTVDVASSDLPSRQDLPRLTGLAGPLCLAGRIRHRQA